MRKEAQIWPANINSSPSFTTKRCCALPGAANGGRDFSARPVTTTNAPTKPNIISIKELYPSWLSGDIVKNIPHKTKTITNKLAIDALFMVFPPLKNTILMPLFLVKKSH